MTEEDTLSATLTIPQAAALLGISRNHAYEEARGGELAGVPVIRIGRRLLVPRVPLERLLGTEPDNPSSPPMA